jgi:hypothetical protein
LREGRNLDSRVSVKTNFGEGLIPGFDGSPLPEKFFEFFDPPSRGG